jgi:mRNA interferase HigB
MDSHRCSSLDEICLSRLRGKNDPARRRVDSWIQDVAAAEWKLPQDVMRSFPSADPIGDNRYVFDIKGNAYRMVAVIIFQHQTVHIRWIGTHPEYDKIDATTI